MFSNSKHASIAATSCLVGYYAAGHSLLNTGHGTTDGIHYGMYMTTIANKQFGSSLTNDVAIIYVLDLPFNSQTHTLGVSKLYNVDHAKFDPFLARHRLQKVAPADDASHDFVLYTTSGQALPTTSTLTSSELALIENYCKNQFWELHDSELYFVVTDDGIGNSNILELSNQFAHTLKQTLPTGQPDAPIIHHEVPYDMYDGPMLSCPLCHQKMELCDNVWFRCVSGHGALVLHREGQRIYHRDLKPLADPRQAIHHGPLTCPNCQYPMQTVLDPKKKVEIDVCTNCAFSWLDADDIFRLTHRRGLFGLGR
jgi:hypothetical protein